MTEKKKKIQNGLTFRIWAIFFFQLHVNIFNLLFQAALFFHFFIRFGSSLICCQTGCQAIPVTECLGFSCMETWRFVWNVYHFQISQALATVLLFSCTNKESYYKKKNSFKEKNNSGTEIKKDPKCIFVWINNFYYSISLCEEIPQCDISPNDSAKSESFFLLLLCVGIRQIKRRIDGNVTTHPLKKYHKK